jgi:hypothetical protein
MGTETGEISMKIERLTHKDNKHDMPHNVYEILVDGVSVRTFNELSDDYALANANELMEEHEALARTRGIVAEMIYG